MSTPWIQTLSLEPPSIKDNTADTDRLLHALKRQLNTDEVHVDLELIRRLPELLRQYAYRIRCILWKSRQQWHLLGVTAAADNRIAAGLAVDLGTTRVVMRLLDLATEHILAESAFDNPQHAVGPDILARIHFAEKENGLRELNELIVNGLNHAIMQLCGSQRLEPQQIYALSVAGNTTMTHLFMGLDPRWIIREPYIPVVNSPNAVKAQTLGMRVNPQARVLIFPNIGSYFGGDLIAGILFSEIYKKSRPCILVDVGTNAEVVLGNENWLIACAGAAGPALEGGVTRMGMTAGPGVIDQIEVDPNTH
ncbi:MAG: ASKHA domain-containing protein, partial [Desulfobacteraceae bacterium]